MHIEFGSKANAKDATRSRDTLSVSRTPMEHHEFLRELISLSLFFAAEFYKQHSGEDISSIIVLRTSMWEITGIRGSAEETAFTGELARLHAKTAKTSEFEREGLALLQSHIEFFAAKNSEWERKVLAKYNDSCFRYDSPSKGAPNHCNFHITNSLSPQSFLKDSAYVISRFLRLMNESGRRNGFDTLKTDSWLNSVSQWLELFPDEWICNMAEPNMEIKGNLGCWGQIITARKTFNFKTGEHIRAHLELPFKPRCSWCSFTAMKRKLESSFF